MSRLSSRLLAVIGLSLLVVAVLSAPASQRRGLNRAAFARLNPVFGAPIAKEIRKPNSLPQGWKVDVEQPINGAELVTLTFALKQRNLDVLEKKFWDVSTPFSGEYGQFLSFSEVSDLVRPTPESVSFVRDWLVSNGIPASQHRITVSGDWLQVDLPVSAAQELLQCRFLAFRHISTDIRILRSLVPYYVPALVAEKIDFVGGVLRFPSIQHASYKEAAAGKTTPQLIRQWYNITDVGKSPLNTQSVSQFLGQFYSPNDLTLFQTQNNLPALQPTVVGPNTPKKPGAEASLDIEYITATAENVKTYFISTAGLHEGQEPFLEWIVGLNNNSDSPYINSISYGDTESTLTVDYTFRINVEFQKFGITGKTLLFSSGDNGVGCDKCTTLQPNFPASSPFVTAVGGTELNSAQTVEVGVTFSSGGFSNYFGVAGYQTTAVKKYFATATTLPPASSYNSTGRGFPDISAFATNFDIVVDGLNTQVDGTSCSSPTSAGIFALLNDLRLQNNQPALGFLNPLIYSLASNTPGAFNDILQGNNDNTCCTGFNAAAGWDPITGVGSPNYAVLKTAVISPSLFE